MSTSRDSESSPADDAVRQGSDAVLPVLEWADQQQRTWGVELHPKRITLRSGADVIDLPADTWARDILVTPHSRGHVIRIETFDFGVGFVVSTEQARPLFDHLGTRPERVSPQCQDPEEPATSAPLLWPRVSPLAVWALISSALVFVPIVGLVPAAATVTLLILHRRTVRRSRTWSHSRALCTAAFVFLLAGLAVSVAATRGMMGGPDRVRNSPTEIGAAPILPSHRPYSSAWAGGTDTSAENLHPIALPVRTENVAAQRCGPAGKDAVDDAALPLAFIESILERDHNWGLLVAGLIVVLFSLSVHEAGHAITAWWLGDDLARRAGRVTLNPRAHIDVFGTILLPLILFLAGVGVFGWAKPVPVRTERLRRPRRDHVLVSLAGPGSNLLIAAASLMLLLGLGCTVGLMAPNAELTNYAIPGFDAGVNASGFALAPVIGPLCTILKLSFLINVILAFFNLIPIPPLDGSWVLENLFPNTLGRLYDRIRPFGFLLFLGLIYSRIIFILLIPAFVVLGLGFLMLEFCTHF